MESHRYRDKWNHITEKNAVAAFVDTLLRAYGQILFCNNPLIGLILLAATFYYPLGGIFGLIGAFSSTMTAVLLHVDRSIIRSGMFGCCGACIGFAWALYLLPSTLLVILLIPAAAFSTLLVLALLATLTRKLNLPVLGLPFCLIAWVVILAMQQFPELALVWQSLVSPFEMAVQAEEGIRNVMPPFISTFFRTLSAIIFQNSILVGIICFIAILIYSRISVLFAIIGGTIGAFFAHFITGPLPSGHIIMQFNCVLIGIALGGFFIVLNHRSVIYALLAVVMGAVLSMAADSFYEMTGFPMLAWPFNLVTLFFLYLLGSGFIDERKSRLHPVPLHLVISPEKSLKWHKQIGGWSEMQKTELSLPFYGTWYVIQGNHGSKTHWGLSAYSWDFLVLDEQRKSHRGSGQKNDDYYSFGLPVLAPNAGVVLKVVNNISDNIPTKANRKQNWGNYVIIDHWNGEFSEISHFKHGSITVAAGETVAKGQILGQCGNSGLSYEAHIHYQLQKGDSVGTETIPTKFSRYIKQTNGTEVMVKAGVPRESDLVRNEE